MSQADIIIEANSNFHHIAGEDLFKKKDARFEEYRERWKNWPAAFYAGEFPLFMDIEVTSACNLRCPFCATTFRGERIKKGFVSPETVTKIIDEGSDNNLYGVKFNIRGEPLLHPRIYEFVRHAKNRGLVDVYFNTNALLLTEEASGKLIDAGLDRLSVSFEGYTKSVYERSRAGSDYDTVLSNIEKMQSLKLKLGVEHPKVRVQTVMFPELERTFDEYRRFWSSRADEVGFLDYKEMKTKKKGVEYPWACPQIWQRMAIWWDGTILPCNHDDEGLLALGNVRDIAVAEAWHSEKLAAVRDAHRQGAAHTVQACDGCYLRDSEIVKLLNKEGKS